jgi:hypothetical protein
MSELSPLSRRKTVFNGRPSLRERFFNGPLSLRERARVRAALRAGELHE